MERQLRIWGAEVRIFSGAPLWRHARSYDCATASRCNRPDGAAAGKRATNVRAVSSMTRPLRRLGRGARGSRALRRRRPWPESGSNESAASPHAIQPSPSKGLSRALELSCKWSAVQKPALCSIAPTCSVRPRALRHSPGSRRFRFCPP